MKILPLTLDKKYQKNIKAIKATSVPTQSIRPEIDPMPLTANEIDIKNLPFTNSQNFHKNYCLISFKGDYFENNYTKKVKDKTYQGEGLMIKNELGYPEWYDFNKVGWNNLKNEPLDWKKAKPRDFYTFIQANALAEGYETTWVRRYNYNNRKKALATSHSIDSRKVKEPRSKSEKNDAYLDMSFATNLSELLDTKKHKSLDKPITDLKGNLCIDAVVFDTETTGTNTSDMTKQLDKIIQIGAIQIKNGKIIEDSAYNQLINPEIHIPESASSVHGIFDEDVKDAPVIESVLKPFVNNYLNKKNGIIVAYNSRFDISMLNNAIKEHNSYSSDELKPKRYFKVLDPFILIQRIHPYVGAVKRLSNQYRYLFCKNLDDAHDAFADVKGTVDVLKYTLYYLSEHRKDKSKPLTLREVLLFQNGLVPPNIDIKLDAQGCNSSVNFRTSYRPVSIGVDNFHDGYVLTKQDIDELSEKIGEKNVRRLKNEIVDEKIDMKLPNGYPINPPETQKRNDNKGLQDAFYVMENNFKKVLGFINIEPYDNKSKDEIIDIITQKAKNYIHKDSIDFWMKNPNPEDIKEGNDLPDFNISRRVMLEELNV